MSLSRKHSGLKQLVLTERLEPRRLLAATAVLNGSTLTITGTSSADRIEVSKTSGFLSGLKVKLDATNTRSFIYGLVKKINVNLGDGNDRYTASNSVAINTTVRGGNGHDDIITGGGNDALYGDAGDDELTEKGGKDSCYGGSGNDSLYADSSFHDADRFDGGDGTDRISYNSRTDFGVDITNDGLANDGVYTTGYGSSEEDNVLPNVETIAGTLADDKILLTGNIRNRIDGIHGDDTLIAGPGNDTVYGGSGMDQILGGDGDDLLIGDGSNDVLYGGSGKDTLSGYSGNDYLRGEKGNDVLAGGDGNDSLNGDEDHDTLSGDSGKDYLSGGKGNDIIFAKDNLYGEVVFGGDGSDVAYIDKLLISLPMFYQPVDNISSIEVWS